MEQPWCENDTKVAEILPRLARNIIFIIFVVPLLIAK